jgi:hypothetical protein
MSPGSWTGDARMRAALGAFLVATGTLAWTVVGALRPAVVPAQADTVSIPSGALDATRAAARVDVAAAVARDLFAPGRIAPPTRYRPPDDGSARAVSPQPPPQPVVLGTAIGSDGSSFATCQFGSSKLLMVRVGDHVGSYVVQSIERGRVVFTTPGGKRLEVLAPRPGS